MTDSTSQQQQPQLADSAWLVERTKTGVSGLDALLGGGLVRGAIYLVMGRARRLHDAARRVTRRHVEELAHDELLRRECDQQRAVLRGSVPRSARRKAARPV